MPLLREISTHYYTEESARHLANLLLRNDDYKFFLRKVPRMTLAWKREDVEWSNFTLDVIEEWAKRRRPNSITLLRAMERSNKKAAKFFQKALTCGEFLSFVHPFFLHIQWFAQSISALATESIFFLMFSLVCKSFPHPINYCLSLSFSHTSLSVSVLLSLHISLPGPSLPFFFLWLVHPQYTIYKLYKYTTYLFLCP